MRKALRGWWLAACLGGALVGSAGAQPHTHAHTHNTAKPAVPVVGVQGAAAPLDAHTQEDVARHQAMAQAHAQAAQCLASGQPHDSCQKQLQASCKGLALGKYCGLRHAH